MDLAEDTQITKTPVLPPKKPVIKNLIKKSQHRILNVRGLT